MPYVCVFYGAQRSVNNLASFGNSALSNHHIGLKTLIQENNYNSCHQTERDSNEE